jgi:hypothetical protein
MKAVEYEKAIAWIVRENPKRPREIEAVAGWRAAVNLTAALFDKSPRDVARDVIEFANAIERTQWQWHD